MSPKKSSGQKAAQARKHRAAAKKAAPKRKHRAAGKKAAKKAATRARKKPPQSAAAPQVSTMAHVPGAIDKTEELPAPTAETSATAEETAEPSGNPDATLKADIEALRNTRWGRR